MQRLPIAIEIFKENPDNEQAQKTILLNLMRDLEKENKKLEIKLIERITGFSKNKLEQEYGEIE